MDYSEFLLSLQLLSEERYGSVVRRNERIEDERMKQSLKQQVKHAPRR